MTKSPEDFEVPTAAPAPEISLSLSPEIEITEREELVAWLRDNVVEEVECVTPDFAGIGRGKVMPAMKFTNFSPVYLPTSLFFLTITGGYPEIENFRAYDTDADLMLRVVEALSRANEEDPITLLNALERLLPAWQTEQRKGRAGRLFHCPCHRCLAAALESLALHRYHSYPSHKASNKAVVKVATQIAKIPIAKLLVKKAKGKTQKNLKERRAALKAKRVKNKVTATTAVKEKVKTRMPALAIPQKTARPMVG